MPELLYPDHDYYVNNAALAWYSDLVTVPVGDGALLVVRLSGSSVLVGNMAPTTAAVSAQGVTTGILRILWYRTLVAAAGDGAGLLCMQSQRDLTVSGNAYGVLWRPADASSGFGLALLKITGGLLAGVSTLVGINSPGVLKALQLEWTLAEDELSIQLIVKISTSLTFGSLVPVLSYTDDTSPFITSVTEGGFAYAASGSAYRMTCDQMSLSIPL